MADHPRGSKKFCFNATTVFLFYFNTTVIVLQMYQDRASMSPTKSPAEPFFATLEFFALIILFFVLL